MQKGLVSFNNSRRYITLFASTSERNKNDKSSVGIELQQPVPAKSSYCTKHC